MVPPGGKRPPYEETVPCETQKPIDSLAAATSGPISQTSSGLTAPGAAARWQGATTKRDPAR